MTKPLVCEAGGCQELEAFDLAEMGSFAEGEEVE